jgi:hypothetical protein
MREFINIIWSDNLPPGRIFICLVALSSIAAAVLALYHTWRYRIVETGVLERVKGSLHRWQKERQGTAQELVSVAELKKVARPKSLIHQRLLTIECMRDANVKVDFEALQQVTYAAEAAKLGLRAPAFSVSFILLLGLFGSIVSLCLALPGLRGGAGADEVSSTIVTMTAAFSCGMAGLVGSLLVSLFNLALTTAQAHFFEQLERFTVEELLPETAPDIRSEALLMEMHFKIGEAFDRIKQIAEQNHQTVKEFETVAEGFVRLVDSLEESARKGASADVQRVLEQMGEVIGQVSRANDSVLNLAGSVPQALEATRTQNQNVLARLDLLGQQAREQHDKLTSELALTNDKLPQALQSVRQSTLATAQRIEEALRRQGGVPVATALLPAPAMKLIMYAVPSLLLLILLILLAR